MGKRRTSTRLGVRRGIDPVRRRLLVETLCDRRVLAAITGTVFEDFDHSYRQEAAESGLVQRLVFIDADESGTLDAGEPIELTDEQGGFSFPGLADGSYLVRLFDGTSTQAMTIPAGAEVGQSPVAFAAAIESYADHFSTIAISTDSLALGDLEDGSLEAYAVGSGLVRMQPLPDGRWLLVGGNGTNEGAWIFDQHDRVVTPIELVDDGTSRIWTDLALDGSGRGVIVEQGPGWSTLRAVDASDDQAGIVVSAAKEVVPRNLTALSSPSGNRSVIAREGEQGLALTLWSNTTASPTHPDPVEIATSTELLAFDDDAGLVVLREAGGGVSVHDVDAEFATLHSLSDVTGPIALSGSREILFTVSPADSMLKLIDLRDGSVLADLAVDLTAIGAVESLVPNGDLDSLVVMGASGLAEVSLKPSASRRITIEQGVAQSNARFGLQLSGTNVAPSHDEPLPLVTREDTTLAIAPALPNAQDDDGDQFVFLSAGSAAHGIASVSPTGELTYIPSENFSGTDVVSVMIHDGRDATVAFLAISVEAIVDPPTAIDVTVNVIPEDSAAPTLVGTVTVVDPDVTNQHEIAVDDPRFEVIDGELIYLGGVLDFETEPLIPLEITVHDSEAQATISEFVSLSISDANDPITGIKPTSAFVFENAIGDTIAELVIEDEDAEQAYDISVDDSRFLVEFGSLRLADGIALDFEVEQFVVVNVTALDVVNNDSFTQPVLVSVRNLAEQPTVIELTNDTVLELEPGAVVGDVVVDGVVPTGGIELTVDDGRFEVVGGTLKLLDHVWVELANLDEIQLVLTAQDVDQTFAPISETFLIQVLENPTPFHNDEEPMDVDGDGEITTVDVLTLINHLNRHGPGPVGAGSPLLDLDVNGDGRITALDVLIILNYLNRQSIQSLAGGEGEWSGPANAAVAPTMVMTPTATAEVVAIGPRRLALANDEVLAILEREEKPTFIAATQPPAELLRPGTSDSALTADDETASVDEELVASIDRALKLLS